jgi:hypothetical protein
MHSTGSYLMITHAYRPPCPAWPAADVSLPAPATPADTGTEDLRQLITETRQTQRDLQQEMQAARQVLTEGIEELVTKSGRRGHCAIPERYA